MKPENIVEPTIDSTTENTEAVKPGRQRGIPKNLKGEPRALMLELMARHPVLAARLPLAIGVRAELVAAGYDDVLLRRVMYLHTHGAKYQAMLAKGGPRFHLDGTEADPVAPEHVEFARKKVEEQERRDDEKLRQQKELKAELKAARAVKLAQLEATAKNAIKAGKTDLVQKAAAGIAKVKAIESAVAKVKQPSSPIAKPSPATIVVVVKKKRIVQVP